MSIEDELRAYRSTLESATDERSRSARRALPTPRVRSTRAFVLATAAIALIVAATAIAIGTSHRRSAPPAVETTTAPSTAPETSTATSTTTTTTVTAPPTNVTLGVVPCETLEAITGGTGRPPSSVIVPAASAAGDPLAAFADKQGRLLMAAPASWTCAAVDAADGGASLELPADTGKQSGSDFNPASPSDHGGLFAISIPACQGCVYSEICGIVPNADAQLPGFQGACTARPAGETVTALGNDTYRIEDPAGTITPDAAISVLRFHPRTAKADPSVVRATCAFQNQRDICTSLLNQFLALQP